MARAVVIGGGPAGLTSALICRAVGYQVDLIEPARPVSGHGQILTAVGAGLLRDFVPDVYRGFLDAGAVEIDHGAAGVAVGCGRDTFVRVFRERLLGRGSVTPHPGVSATGLVAAAGRVTGVSAGRREFAAELVVDAAGRESPVGGWLADEGLPGPRVSRVPSPGRLATLTFRSADPIPVPWPGPLVFDHYAAAVAPIDAGTVSVTLRTADPVRGPEHFTAITRATPAFAALLAGAEPGSTVDEGPVPDRVLRQYPRPVPGLVHVGAANCAGDFVWRHDVSTALNNAHFLGLLLQGYPTVDAEQARRASEEAERLLTPWFASPSGVGRVLAAAAVDEVVAARWTRVAQTVDTPAALFEDEELRVRVEAAAPADAVAPGGAPRAVLLAV